ncbi:oxidoreductase 2OG-Fe(II) oxygenase family [Apiospora saccharicola]|uniref:Oxidoreductase 2OG-Fe(II) oxygenase family n=1 Tax=Apiospora saccharicola TaxID=335842 RepID=A0ABR1WEA3_9PEZI
MIRTMFSYVVAGVALLLSFYNPLQEYFCAGGVRPHVYSPRPAINESLLATDAPGDREPNCAPHSYSVQILSKAPLVIYIENFLSTAERELLLDISDPLFEPSTITNNGAETHRDATIRDSEVALLPRSAGAGADAVRCIERRALAFQGWRDGLWLERLRTQRYGPSQHYAHHFDWGSGALGWGRVSSFMVWVDAAQDLEGGGTEFPYLRRRGLKKEWCRWVECVASTSSASSSDDSSIREEKVENPYEDGEEEEMGLVFKPAPGNAVFWENFRPDGTGRGWENTWHAGLPVRKGFKVGLNIWSWGRLDYKMA